MTEFHRTKARDAHERVYRLLLRLHARSFRDEFGDAMVEFFRDRLAAARTTGGQRALLRLWGRSLGDLLRHAPASRLEALRAAYTDRRDRRDAARRSPRIHHARREDRMIASILQDLRYALRALRRTPAFSATVLVTLALGIGANVAIFSVVHGVLLKRLPYEDPDRIVHVAHQEPGTLVSEPEFVDYRRDAKAIERLAAYRSATVSLTGTNVEPERITLATVSEGFFDILGARPLLGRPFIAEEEQQRGPRVAILSYGLWQRRFGGDSAVIGRDVVLQGTPRTVVGVMPARFAFPSPDIALWLPMRLNYDTLWTRNNHYLEMIGRLAPGMTVTQASLELNGMARRFMTDFPEVYSPDQPLVAVVTPLPDLVLARTRPYLTAMFGAVAFVLLIACVNVANLLLARGETRRRELAIRTAMGASRARVVRQVLTESVVFALGGGILGLGIALGGVRAVRALAPADLPRVEEITVAPLVLAFALAVTLGTGLLFGVVPALRGAREDAAESLKEGGKTSSGQARGLGRARRALVVAELALAVVTLAGAGLMIRSLWKLQALDLGFRTERLLTMRVAPPEAQYTGGRAAPFYETLVERVRAIPGVQGAAAVYELPVADGNSMWSILVNGAPMGTVANSPAAMPQTVSPGYFEVMGITVLQGRGFTAADRAGAPLTVVINETMAREHWPDRSPLGGTIKMLNEQSQWATVVGVVRDVRSNGFLGRIPPTMYFPHAQAGQSAYYVPSAMSLAIRTRGEPEGIIPAVRRIIRELEPAAPISRIRTMDQVVAESVASRRFTTQLLAGFAALALLLAGVGLYGVVSYAVTQRRFEIGVRLALGASQRQVIGLVLREGLRTAAIGAVTGLAGAIAVTRLMRSLFVDVQPADPITLASVVGILVVVALVASLVPARRASAVDPMRALRAE
ncbi:MAG TPA: ABC transporter permease [Gemmatimonadaceae bacterium]|nr:ABC transporter permease [Gemmatimonadaceae bacterium]